MLPTLRVDEALDCDLLEFLPDRPDPFRVLAAVCRCGDRGDITRGELVAAAAGANETHKVVVLIR